MYSEFVRLASRFNATNGFLNISRQLVLQFLLEVSKDASSLLLRFSN